VYYKAGAKLVKDLGLVCQDIMEKEYQKNFKNCHAIVVDEMVIGQRKYH
jgi:hypothetical protein